MMNNKPENLYDSHSQDLLLCQIDNGILTLTFNRPDKANALSTPMLQSIISTLEHAHKDPRLKAIILTGSGDRVFSGGADLREMEAAEKDPDFEAEYFSLWENTTNAIMNFPLPTIALINGACVAGGLSLALACDIRLATENAFMSYPRVADGHLPGRHNLTRLVQLIGESRTKMIMLLGYRIYAVEAHTWGLVDTVLGMESFADDLKSILAQARQSESVLLAATKTLIGNYNDNETWDSAQKMIESRE